MGVSGPTLVSSSFSSAAIMAVSLSLEKSWLDRPPVPIVERLARLEQSLPCGSSPQTVLRLLRLRYVGKSGSWEMARTYRHRGRRFARRDRGSARVQGPATLHTPAA